VKKQLLVVCTDVKYLFLVDGGWSDWKADNCSVKCGGGIKEKFRTCDNPAPSCGGKECNGLKVETTECNEFSCEDEGSSFEGSSLEPGINACSLQFTICHCLISYGCLIISCIIFFKICYFLL